MAWTVGQDVTAALMNTNAPQEWTAYTPTVAGFSVGSGSTVGRYCAHGDTVVFRAEATLGSGFSAGATFTLSTPFAVVNGAAAYAFAIDVGSNFYLMGAVWGASNLGAFVIGANGAAAATGTNSPFTWASGDVLQLAGVFER